MEWKMSVTFVAGLLIGGIAGYQFGQSERKLGMGVALFGIVGMIGFIWRF